MALGWLPCLMLVVTCVSLDQSGAINIGYGSLQFCWITNGLATIYVFAIPIALALITDVIFYALTIRAIKTTASQAQIAAGNSKRRGHFGIYVRLASVMGFTWVFGFGAALLWSRLWYVFVSLNCLQGVYLAAAFALSDQARKLYRQLLGPRADHLRNTATSTVRETHENKIETSAI
ncbi:G-protein coupled receptor Mth2-like [Nematostella vectensis]|uniref:G-protein coupled receptor Mth2-like n=1 Tax=Nematostella vectensis TaxID=45351 RepID=UPI00207780BB|nr:G-protein coupled receptor Mth2-like [Nematostella vectensis]